jgi:spore maturation protein CgeB/SAM-dependent methyltransferase
VIVHPYECGACGAQVLYEFPYQRDDGRKIRICVACGTGSIPDHGLDLGKIYGSDYWLEGRDYGYDVDPTIRHWQNNLWKVYLLHKWGLQLAGANGRTQVVDVGAGASPARALTRQDRDRLRWRDADMSGFALDFVEQAYGKCEEPFKDPDFLLMSFFEVLEHVDNPVGFLKEHLDSVRQAGFAVIYVPHASPEQAWEAGGDWIQLHNSLEHLQFFSKDGLAAVLKRTGLGGAILTNPVGLLAIADLTRKSTEIVHFDDWKAFAAHCGVPEHALAVYACLNGIVPFGILGQYVAIDPVLERVIAAGEGRTTPFHGEYGPQFNYDRIASEFSFATIVEDIQAKRHSPKDFIFPEVTKAVSYRDMPLFNSTGGPLNVLYVGMKWDYGVPEQGWSFEHHNLYPALFYSPCVKSFLHYDYVEIARRHGVTEMSRGLIEVAQRFKPDLVFIVFYNDEFDPNNEALLRISDLEWCGATIVGFFFDDIYRFDSHTRLRADVISACVTTLPESNDNPYVNNGYTDKVIYSSAGANPLYYHRRPVKEYKYDVSLFGLPHSNRRVIVERLKEAGIDIATFGKGWSPTSRISFAEMLDVIQTSKIVLNPSQSAHGAPGQVKGRTFEVPACGRLLLTGPMDGLEKLYDIADEMPVFYDYADLIDKIRLFLANDKLREQVAENGWRRTMAEHTWEHRIQQIFRTVAPHRTFPDPPRYDVGR